MIVHKTKKSLKKNTVWNDNTFCVVHEVVHANAEL